MRDTLDQNQILYDFINASALKTAVTGKIYYDNRPTGSVVEDIVINSINLSSGDIQRGTSNVNIYVRDIISADGKLKQSDSARLKQISNIAKPILKKHYGQYYNFRIALITIIEEQGTDFSYLNIRIDFRFYESQP